MQAHFMYPDAERKLLTQIVRSPQFPDTIQLPLIPWQHLGLMLFTYGTLLGLGAAYLLAYIPYWLMLFPCAFAIYASFTPLHDATHRSVSRHAWVNDIVGTLAAQPLLPGATVPVYRFLHLEHHRHTGDKDLDPDEPLVSSPPLLRFFKLMFVEVFWVAWYIKHRDLQPKRAWLRDAVSALVFVSWHAVWLLSPYAWEFVLVWMVPQRLGILATAYFFASIQHPEGVLQSDYPLQATRMMKGYKLTRVLMLGQSQHLIHHMFPMIPFYRYNAMWKLAKPEVADVQLTWSRVIGTQPVPHDLQHAPEARYTVSISRVEDVADDVKAFTFRGESLPEFAAGAHIDVHLSNGLVRQYSLLPSEPGTYTIAVKYEADGRGGSRYIHEQWRQGTTLSIGAPRNIFALDSGQQSAVLVAGGIGITPLLSMANTLSQQGIPFEFHISAANAMAVPFGTKLVSEPYSDQLHFHFSQTEQARRFALADMPQWQEGKQLYVCGSNGFMDAIIEYAKGHGWPENAIHTERFTPLDTTNDNQPFTVTLAKSGRELVVPTDRSLLEALQENHVPIQASCMQGICATCKCKVLEGEVTHHDVVLTEEEKAQGVMTACVSRAQGESLVLDC